jgi:hypothetical protein
MKYHALLHRWNPTFSINCTLLRLLLLLLQGNNRGLANAAMVASSLLPRCATLLLTSAATLRFVKPPLSSPYQYPTPPAHTHAHTSTPYTETTGWSSCTQLLFKTERLTPL